MRIMEFLTSSRKSEHGLRLFAWAKYKRGDTPTQGEFDYINGRVISKYPKAELVAMHRNFVPYPEGEEPVEVRWEFEWRVYGIENVETSKKPRCRLLNKNSEERWMCEFCSGWVSKGDEIWIDTQTQHFVCAKCAKNMNKEQEDNQ